MPEAMLPASGAVEERNGGRSSGAPAAPARSDLTTSEQSGPDLLTLVENADEQASGLRRRRRRGGPTRRRQVVVRFSDEEWDLVIGRAGDAGLAVGAWIGQIAVDGATGHVGSVRLPDLIRLHADVLRVEGLLCPDEPGRSVLDKLVERLDAAVDAVVVEIEGRRR